MNVQLEFLHVKYNGNSFYWIDYILFEIDLKYNFFYLDYINIYTLYDVFIY